MNENKMNPNADKKLVFMASQDAKPLNTVIDKPLTVIGFTKQTILKKDTGEERPLTVVVCRDGKDYSAYFSTAQSIDDLFNQISEIFNDEIMGDGFKCIFYQDKLQNGNSIYKIKFAK